MALIVSCFYFRMLAYTYEDGLHIDSFKLPIACSCHIRYAVQHWRQTTAFFIRAAYWGLFGGIFYGSGVTGPQLPVQCVSKYSVLHPICHCHTALLHYNIPAAFVISTTENTLYFKSLLYSSIIYVVKKKKKIYIYIESRMCSHGGSHTIKWRLYKIQRCVNLVMLYVYLSIVTWKWGDRLS